MQRGGTGGHGDRLRRPDVLPECLLELLNSGAGPDPAGPERFRDRLDLLLADSWLTVHKEIRADRIASLQGRHLRRGSHLHALPHTSRGRIRSPPGQAPVFRLSPAIPGSRS